MATTSRQPYQSDLTDEQWALLQPLIPPAKPGGRQREVEMREVINTILYERVEILGFVDGATGDIIAVSLKREGFDDATDDVKLRCPVDMGLTANPLVVTLGVQVDTNTPGFTCEYDDTTITCDNFFTRLAADPAAIVEVVDEEADGAFDTVEVKEE